MSWFLRSHFHSSLVVHQTSIDGLTQVARSGDRPRAIRQNNIDGLLDSWKMDAYGFIKQSIGKRYYAEGEARSIPDE